MGGIIEKIRLSCGYTLIPLIINQKTPSKQVQNIAYRTFSLLEKESYDEKHTKNYKLSGLNLKQMEIFSVLYDWEQDSPVLVTGAQYITKNTCRLFSRYYVFKKYRTRNNKTYNKVDDFQVDMWHYEKLKKKFSLFFWSREKGNRFFNYIKKVRPDIFGNWNIYNENIELVWKNNWQSIFYIGSEKYIKELIFNK
mgnify:CR=1 FL=1